MVEIDLESYGKTLLTDPNWKLIKTSKEEASDLMAKRYRVIPIRSKTIPLKYKPPVEVTRPTLKYSADIDTLLNLVSEDSLYTWVQRLQDFRTRYSYSDSVRKARDWLYDKLLSFGIDSLWFHYYYWDSQQWNVVATVQGTVKPDRVVVVGGITIELFTDLAPTLTSGHREQTTMLRERLRHSKWQGSLLKIPYPSLLFSYRLLRKSRVS
jgi:hypothetical protein